MPWFHFRDASGNPIDPNTWNYMQPRDLLNPRVFLCKAGRFIENVVKKNMVTKEDTPYVKETYINDNFQESCDEHDIENVSQQFGSGSSSGANVDCSHFTDEELNAEVITSADIQTCKEQAQLEGSGSGSGLGSGAGEEGSGAADDIGPREGEDFPILVFEGLEKPKEGQTDEEMIADLLSHSTNISALSVRRAIRLPILQENSLRSLVLVEVDTVEHENEIILEKSKFKSKRRKVEIRKAKFKELWKYVEELTVVKRLDDNNNDDGGVDGSDDDDNAVEIVGDDTTTEKLKPMFKSTTATTTTTTIPPTTAATAATTPATTKKPAVTTATTRTTAASEQKESQSQPRKLKQTGRWSKILFF